ncbi:MAG: MazG nucleotide pyrophosphohydrolase domain-containing protein, partial [Hasllibacter sp.]
DADGAAGKIAEEAAELAQARAAGDADDIEEEVGDLLFTAANLARLLDVDPEAALRRTNAKVVRRFGALEGAMARDGLRPGAALRERMEREWDRAKAAEKTRQD